ncbi:hypothetical protein D6D24_04993 [Aureobasidium pullulans]|uniref:Secreted protein n=1 Tax=Aureobasidium pullulans TaxID=5580 RepID=A0A4S8VSS0_AURPU|nr:hypothetical protein D6D26_09524 [Aureobasidium pullulans]THW15389.1 hypothetical protein D6D24_04993 [Aureobasidium pullulans]
MTMRLQKVVDCLCILALTVPALDRAGPELSTSRQTAPDDGAVLWVFHSCVPGLRGRDDREGEEEGAQKSGGGGGERRGGGLRRRPGR